MERYMTVLNGSRLIWSHVKQKQMIKLIIPNKICLVPKQKWHGVLFRQEQKSVFRGAERRSFWKISSFLGVRNEGVLGRFLHTRQEMRCNFRLLERLASFGKYWEAYPETSRHHTLPWCPLLATPNAEKRHPLGWLHPQNVQKIPSSEICAEIASPSGEIPHRGLSSQPGKSTLRKLYFHFL